MGHPSILYSQEVDYLIRQAVGGDRLAGDEVFARFRDRLLKMIHLRMDRRLRDSIAGESIVQEAFRDAWQRLPEYLANPPISFFLWLRFLTAQRLSGVQSSHLGTEQPLVDLGISLYRGPMPDPTSASLAAQLLGRVTSPSLSTIRAETQIKVQEVLNGMDPVDREVLVLRHFEHLGNAEVAELLQLTSSAASKRYITALKRLKEALTGLPGFEW